jgi:hypothetical protein
MYRVLLTRGHKAYAVECSNEFNKEGDYYDNLFDENIREFVDNGDVVVLIDDLEDFDRYIKGYELEIVDPDE